MAQLWKYLHPIILCCFCFVPLLEFFPFGVAGSELMFSTDKNFGIGGTLLSDFGGSSGFPKRVTNS